MSLKISMKLLQNCRASLALDPQWSIITDPSSPFLVIVHYYFSYAVNQDLSNVVFLLVQVLF